MNDPHVNKLFYKIDHRHGVAYDKAAPADFSFPSNSDRSAFRVYLAAGEAVVELCRHFPSEREARAFVEPFLEAWELAASLKDQPGEIKFSFERGEIIDRQPQSGEHRIVLPSAHWAVSASPLIITLRRHSYPRPPERELAITTDVQSLYARYCGYREGREPLASMAYFCLTVIERLASPQVEKRDEIRLEVGRLLSCDVDILRKIGELSTERGGNEARKARRGSRDARPPQFTPAERDWLDAAVRQLILRFAEWAAGEEAPLPPLTMARLPPL